MKKMKKIQLLLVEEEHLGLQRVFLQSMREMLKNLKDEMDEMMTAN
jgi:ABC-type branched-subunit amino acid transport system ATPase component